MYGPLLVLCLDLVVCAAANTYCECQCMEVNHNITTTSLPEVVHPQLVADARASFPWNPLLPLGLFLRFLGCCFSGSWYGSLWQNAYKDIFEALAPKMVLLHT